jgi:hypothetical protein
LCGCSRTIPGDGRGECRGAAAGHRAGRCGAHGNLLGNRVAHFIQRTDLARTIGTQLPLELLADVAAGPVVEHGARDHGSVAANVAGQSLGAHHGVDDPGDGGELDEEHDGMHSVAASDVRVSASNSVGQIVRKNVQGSRVDNGCAILSALFHRDASPGTDDCAGWDDVSAGAAGGVGRSDRDGVRVLGGLGGPNAVVRSAVGSRCGISPKLMGRSGDSDHSAQAGGLQDSGSFGLYVRLPAGRVVEMLRAYVRDMQLRVDPRCSKASQHGARCPFCDPVWPKAVLGRRAKSAPRQMQGMSRQQVSCLVKIALEGRVGKGSRAARSQSTTIRGGVIWSDRVNAAQGATADGAAGPVK